MTYQFDSTLAVIYGVDEAIMIANFEFWIRKNQANGRHFYDGRYWTYNSVEAFTNLFPFWSRKQVRRILKSLEDKGVIVTGNYNSQKQDRTTWYAFSDAFLNGQMQLPKRENAIAQMGKCNNIVNIPEDSIFTDNKPDNSAVAESDTRNAPKSARLKDTSEGLCLFKNSRYALFENFEKEFAAAEFQDIDLAYYFHAVADWSSQGGKKRKDWVAVARNFMRGDKDAGRLHTKSKGVGLSPDAIKYLQDMAE